MKDTIPLVKIKDISTKIGSGATPRGGKESYKEFGISLIRSLNVYDYKFDLKNLAKIDEYQAQKLKNVIVEKNDILLNITGASVARCTIVPNKILPARVNQHVSIIRIKKNLADAKYVLNTVNSNSFKNGLLNLAYTGATREALTKDDISNFKIPFPSLPIQKKIAAILTTYDELIENNNRRIAILEKMAEEIYREWFVRLRFPGHEKVNVVKGVPEGWKLKRFRDLISYYIGGGWGNDYQDIKFYKPAYVIRGTDIPKLNVSIFKHEILRYHKPSNFKTRQLIKDDIVFEVSGGSKDQLLGRTLLITKDLLKFFNSNVICASFCKLIRPNQENVNPLFLKYFFKLYYDTGMVGTFQTQSTGISNYHFEDFLNFQTLNVPDITIQKKFGNTIQPIIEEKDALSLENSTLKQSRDLLLPRLINGKLDVKRLDIVFPPGMRNTDPAEGKEADAA